MPAIVPTLRSRIASRFYVRLRMAKKLLEVAAVAERLQLASGTLAKWRVRGGGPPFLKLGAKVLYPEDELEAWLGSQPLLSSTADGVTRRPGAGRKPAARKRRTA